MFVPQMKHVLTMELVILSPTILLYATAQKNGQALIAPYLVSHVLLLVSSIIHNTYIITHTNALNMK